MKKIGVFVVLFSFIISCSTIMKTSGFRLPEYKTVQLENGLELLLIPSRNLPSTSLIMMLKSGSFNDPKTKSGLMNLTVGLLERGSENLSATQIADQFGFLGSGFSASVSDDYVLLSATALSKDREELVSLFSEVILTPKFSTTEVSRLKNEIKSNILRSYDSPSSFTNRVFGPYLMGQHPYGQPTEGTLKDLQSIQQKDIRTHYKTHFVPANATLAVVGDFSEHDVDIIKNKFSAWEKSDRPERKPLDSIKLSGLEILVVDRPDLEQAQIRIGHEGISRDSEDFLTLRIANTILGGVFSSRLMKEIRVERGLTYGISSSFDAKKDIGPFMISMAVRHDKVGEAIQETLNVVKKFQEEGADKKELTESVSYLKGVFPRAIETPEQLATNLLILKYYGISDRYLTDYFAKLERIGLRYLNQVVSQKFKTNDVRILVYAPKSQVVKQLEPIGNVKTVPHTDYH